MFEFDEDKPIGFYLESLARLTNYILEKSKVPIQAVDVFDGDKRHIVLDVSNGLIEIRAFEYRNAEYDLYGVFVEVHKSEDDYYLTELGLQPIFDATSFAISICSISVGAFEHEFESARSVPLSKSNVSAYNSLMSAVLDFLQRQSTSEDSFTRLHAIDSIQHITMRDIF